MDFHEVLSRGIGPERFEKKWRGYVTDVQPGEWPKTHSQWFPPGWALSPERIQLEPLPCQWPLAVQLVPRSAQGRGPSRRLPRGEWNLVACAVAKRAGYRGEICGSQNLKSNSSPVQPHEKWSFDDLRKEIRLEGMQALCRACRQARVLASVARGSSGQGERRSGEANRRFAEALGHLASVNGWDPLHAELYAKQQLLRREARSRFEWTVELGPALQGPAYRAWLRKARACQQQRSQQQRQSGARKRSTAGNDPVSCAARVRSLRANKASGPKAEEA